MTAYVLDAPVGDVMRISLRGDKEQVYVTADRYQEVQQERDLWRRTCHLLNAWFVDRERSDDQFVAIVDKVGLTWQDGEVMQELVRAIKSGALDQAFGSP